MKKICKLLLTLAVLVAPTASGFCRTYFYEEKEPDNLDAFCKLK